MNSRVEISDLIYEARQYISCIKVVRTLTGCGLKEGKQFVDESTDKSCDEHSYNPRNDINYEELIDRLYAYLHKDEQDGNIGAYTAKVKNALTLLSSSWELLGYDSWQVAYAAYFTRLERKLN
jgi:hypothetical protein